METLPNYTYALNKEKPDLVISAGLMRCFMQNEKLMARIQELLSYLRKNSTRIGTLLIIVAVLAVAVGMNVHAVSYTYVVYLDNQEIGFVSDEADILEYVEKLHEEEAERYGLQVKPLQEIRVEREQRSDIQADEWTVKDQLRRGLEYDVYAYVIIVNDKPTLAVRTIEDYDSVIKELKGAYVSGKDNTVIQAVVLNDQVEARLTLVDPDALYSADKAADILRRGTDRRETYLVSRGDSLWTIARSNNMTVSEIQQANPQLGDSDRLQQGDELSLVVADPLVSVSVTEEVVLPQRIPFETKYQNDSKMYKGATKVIDRKSVV